MPANGQPRKEPAAEVPREGGADAGGWPARILVVDDVALMRSLLVRALTAEGYDVSTARNGKQALEMARSDKPDLILLDSMMPVMSGPQCLAALKADPATAEIPVVMCTARTEKPDVIEAVKLGACDYIIKPFKIEVLLEHVAWRLAGGRDPAGP